ncbi:MAG: ABC transporter permease [Ruminococcus sp.]|nr:ABC transporter permease [Ruminococcus sp.]MBQ9679685.1 ABC transporter permease [Ruminococcus sp.]
MSGILSYFSSLNPLTFLSQLPGNIAQGIIWGLMGLGVFITYKLLDFADLSVDGSFATGGAVTAVLIIAGVPVWAAVLIAMLAGIIAGLVTGFLHTVLGIPGILAGILTQIALYSINLNIMGKANVPVSYRNYDLLLSASNINMAIIIGLVLVAVVIILMYWYFGTEQGSAIRSTGSNPSMSKAQGINISTMKVIALALSNGLVALSGSLFAQYQGFADINMGRGAIVIGLAAVVIGTVIGEGIFKKGMNFILRLFFVVVGAVLYYIAMGLVLWLKMPTDDTKLFTAVVVAVFLAVPYLQDKSKTSFKKVAKRSAKLLTWNDGEGDENA